MNNAPDVQQVFRGRSIITKAIVDGQNVFFLSTHFRDVIQREHRMGRFYEPEELDIIKRHFKPGDTFCDIGCNIGNHTIFAGLFLQPSKIICFEPNKDIIPVLRANVMLNNLEKLCDLTHLGFGLSEAPASGLSLKYSAKNTGAGRITEGDGDIEVRSGDAMIGNQQVNFLKIDVEGMELKVLSGLQKTIFEQKPRVFIEVENGNISDVGNYFSNLGYVKKEEWRRYSSNINLLFLPSE